jgi:hypothetical protein
MEYLSGKAAISPRLDFMEYLSGKAAIPSARRSASA